MYEHVKTGCKHIPPSEQPLQFQSGYYLNKRRIFQIKRLRHSPRKLVQVVMLATYIWDVPVLNVGRDTPKLIQVLVVLISTLG